MNFGGPEKPLFVSLTNNIPPPEEIYFYERSDGSIVALNEREAWNSSKIQNLSGNIDKKFKQIGVSDGTIYNKAIEEAREIFTTSGLKASQERIRKGYMDELEAARGHFKKPRNFEAVDLSGDVVNMKSLQ